MCDLLIFLHKVAPEGKYVAFLSTNVEGACEGMSAEQIAHRELGAGLSVLTQCAPIRIFYDVYDLLAPTSDGTADKVIYIPAPPIVAYVSY